MRLWRLAVALLVREGRVRAVALAALMLEVAAHAELAPLHSIIHVANSCALLGWCLFAARRLAW